MSGTREGSGETAVLRSSWHAASIHPDIFCEKTSLILLFTTYSNMISLTTYGQETLKGKIVT